MKIIKKYAFLFIGIILFLFFVSFFGDGLLFFLSVSDDKVYDNNNKYIDPTLTGAELEAESNLKESYKLNQEVNNVSLTGMKFFTIIIKIFSIFILPLLLYFLFIKKDVSIFEFIENTFKK